MNKYTPIPIFGSIPSLSTTVSERDASDHDLLVKAYAPYKRFAVLVEDDGLDTAGLMPGDWAIFREQGWPNEECQVCCLSFGDETTLRIVELIYDVEPRLRVCGDKMAPIRRHRNDFIIRGVLDGIIKRDFAELLPREEPMFDWGC